MLQNFPTTIALGASTSSEINAQGYLVSGVYIPTGFTGTTITFQTAMVSGGTYSTIDDGSGASYTKTVAAGQYIPLDPANFGGVQFLKIISGSTEGAARSLSVVVRTNY